MRFAFRCHNPYTSWVSLYWLCYRRHGTFAGAAVFEASLLVEAHLKAALAGVGDGFGCAGFELAESARQYIPKSMIGRMLSLSELGRLEARIKPRILAAAWVRRRAAGERSAAQCRSLGASKAAAMPKTKKSRLELEELVLTELRRARNCADARSVNVTAISLDDEGFDTNWAVDNFDPGQSDIGACEDALTFIVPRLQNEFDLEEG
jgi:hypothetical protein